MDGSRADARATVGAMANRHDKKSSTKDTGRKSPVLTKSFRRLIRLRPCGASRPVSGQSSFSRRSPMQRQRAQTSSSAGASPAAGTTFITAPVAQRRGSGLNPRQVPVQVRPGAPLHGTRTGPARRDSLLRKSSRTAGWGACPPRSAIFHQTPSMPVHPSDAPATWNANRTSVPGFLGKEIVPHPAGWGAFPPRSAIFHPGRVAQLAEARRRERRECWFKSSRDHHFPYGPEA